MYVPDKVLSNLDLEKMVDTSDEWIFTRTGIRERRMANEEESASYMGAKASQKALDAAGISATDLDLIITATFTPDAVFPSTACFVQEKLGCPGVPAMDLQAACSGFLYGLITASQFIKTGAYKNILVIGSEKISSTLDWNDRATCVLFGDGAGAAVVSAADEGTGGAMLGFDLGADGAAHNLLYLHNQHSPEKDDGEDTKDGPFYVKMAGREIFKKAVNSMGASVDRVLTEAGVTLDEVKCLIPHQANVRIIDALATKVEFPKDKCFVNVSRYGNISAACIPVALTEAYEQNYFERGDKILMVAFGGGLTWATALMEW